MQHAKCSISKLHWVSRQFLAPILWIAFFVLPGCSGPEKASFDEQEASAESAAEAASAPQASPSSEVAPAAEAPEAEAQAPEAEVAASETAEPAPPEEEEAKAVLEELLSSATLPRAERETEPSAEEILRQVQETLPPSALETAPRAAETGAGASGLERALERLAAIAAESSGASAEGVPNPKPESPPADAPASAEKPAPLASPPGAKEETLPVATAEPKPEAKSEPKPEPNPEAKVEPKPEPKPEAPQVAGAKEPPPAAKPAEPEEKPAQGAAPPAAPPERPKGVVILKELHHKTAEEFLRFAREMFPEWVSKGHVEKIEGKARSVLVRGETPAREDPLAQKILEVIADFDDLELKVESRKIKPRYVNISTVIDALTMRGIANVWKVTETTNVATWKVGDKQMSASSKNLVYAPTGIVPGAVAPIPVPPRIPYVYEIVSSDPFPIPLVYGGANNVNQPLVDFRNTTSTEERGTIVAVGTPRDLEAIQAFIDEIDKPARQILVEVEVIQLDASKLSDIGIDSVQFGKRHTIGNIGLTLPGETVVQPGIPGARRPGIYVPPITEEGFSVLFDDTTEELAGRFIANLHALVRTGEAQYRARPKILTLDDRQSVLHIGENVPVFKSTGVTRDATVGSFVSEVRNVDAIYVGFTLNIRPRISGGAEDEVSLNIEVSVNELGERQRVFAEDLLGIPNIIKRQYIGQNRVKNHRPIVLGGLISEQESESVSKIPLLGDIPYLGMAFRRTLKTKQRQEVIFVLTPHILSEKGWDRFAAPKESSLFDTYDSVLFNDTHIIKGKDVLGIDPISGAPARMEDGKIFTEEEVVDLTLLNIVKQRELVSKLRIIDNYLPEGAKELNWIQRRWPEATVRNWPEAKREIFYRAAAIVIENIKELNPDLTYEEIVVPRRQIILPTTPYRISLSYDRVKALEKAGAEYVFRARNELSEKTIELLRQASVRSLRQFADYLERERRSAEDHGDLIVELKELYAAHKPLESSEVEGISYPEVYRKLGEANFDFLSLATFFAARKRDRADYNPNIGRFELDVQDFLAVSLSLPEKAKWLKELDERWERLAAAKAPEAFRASEEAEEGRR